MTDTRISQPIEITRNHFPTLGMCGHGVRVNIAGGRRMVDARVTIPGDLASGGPGGKSQSAVLAPLSPSRFFLGHLVRLDFLWVEMPEIKIGDIVFLNSGSPPLTVIGWDEGNVHVRWRANAELNYGKYPPACLTFDVSGE